MSNWRDELLQKLMKSRTARRVDEPKEHTWFVGGTPSPNGSTAPNSTPWTLIGVDWGMGGVQTETVWRAGGLREETVKAYTRQDAEVSQRIHNLYNEREEHEERRKWGEELLVDCKAATTTGAEQLQWKNKQFEIRKRRAAKDYT